MKKDIENIPNRSLLIYNYYEFIYHIISSLSIKFLDICKWFLWQEYEKSLQLAIWNVTTIDALVNTSVLNKKKLKYLSETLLSCPYGRMNDLQKQLSSTRVENKDGTIDRLGGQIALESFMYSHTVNICVVHKPDDLIGE